MTNVDLKNAVLSWIKNKYSDNALSAQIDDLVVIKTESSGCGFFFDLEVKATCPKLSTKIDNPISGPYFRSSGIEDGGGSLLFHSNGYLNMLEFYAYGDRFDEVLSECELLEEL